MKALVVQAITAVAVPYTALAQPADYRITESTQACERWDMVHGSVENAKRGAALNLGCAPVPKDREVRLIQRKGDLSQVEFCTSDGCLRRWLLTSVLGAEGV
jgi:hypothetical protein